MTIIPCAVGWLTAGAVFVLAKAGRPSSERRHGVLQSLCRWLRTGRGHALDEGAQARDCFAHDQVLHLVGALVGVERLSICEEASDAVLKRDPVAAADLPGPRHRL